MNGIDGMDGMDGMNDMDGIWMVYIMYGEDGMKWFQLSDRMAAYG